MDALRRLVSSPHAVIARVAHALGVMLQMRVLAPGDPSRLVPPLVWTKVSNNHVLVQLFHQKFIGRL